MRLDEIIQQHTKALSSQLQAEVFGFILFLGQKQAQVTHINDQRQRKGQLKNTLDKTVALDIFAGGDGVAWQNG